MIQGNPNRANGEGDFVPPAPLPRLKAPPTAGAPPAAPEPSPTSAPPTAPAQTATPAAAPIDPRVWGESLYDRVSSLLISVVIGALLVTGVIVLIAATTQAYNIKATSPIRLVDFEGGGGGTPEGTVGSVESIDVPGAEAAPAASNNPEEPADFEEPSVMQTPDVMLEPVLDAGKNLAEVDVAESMPHGGPTASGKRASKLGTGGPGFGFGPGDGGVPRAQRWSIIYNPGQTVEEYARQLDAFGVELGTFSGNNVVLASHLSEATPQVRVEPSSAENRLYFLWQGQGRKASDVALLRKAGIDVGEGVILQFYPEAVENLLAQLEVRYQGRQPGEIRTTRFGVVPTGNGYAFEVLAQDTLR